MERSNRIRFLRDWDQILLFTSFSVCYVLCICLRGIINVLDIHLVSIFDVRQPFCVLLVKLLLFSIFIEKSGKVVCIFRLWFKGPCVERILEEVQRKKLSLLNFYRYFVYRDFSDLWPEDSILQKIFSTHCCQNLFCFLFSMANWRLFRLLNWISY